MRYAAFLSYSHSDRAMGERIQKALESYVVPAPLQGQDFGRGPVAKRITPIFRDRWDAHAHADLGATLRAALEASDALIVLCSPAAARSRWVDEEIRSFKRAGRDDRIYAVIAEGLPDRFDPQQEPMGAFPPALFEQWDASSGQWMRIDSEPLAPDAREGGDGVRFTILKLVAALTGIPLTTLTQRQAEAERRARNRARWVAGVMTLLAASAVAGAWLSWQATLEARRRLENAVEMAARRVDDAAGFHDRYGVPRSVINELLNGAQKDFDELTRDAPATPTLKLQRARLDRLFSHLYEVAGDTTQQEAMAMRALERLATVPVARRADVPSTWFAQLPAGEKVQIERILALEAAGTARAVAGDAVGARELFLSMAREADAARARTQTVAARALASNARSHLARLSYEAADLETALQTLQEAAALLSEDGGDAKLALDLAKVQSDAAEMLLELGRHEEAFSQQQLAVETLAKAAATPAAAKALGAALARRGDMRLAARRDLKGAIADYGEARSMLEKLLAADVARTDVKRDLSLAHERVGDALLQSRDVAAAAEAFATCLALRRELVARDASNAEWRRDLSVALERVGQVESLRGQHDAAALALGEALGLRKAALAAKPEDIVARRDLAIIWLQLGNARMSTGARSKDIEHAYEQAIELLAPLVDGSDPESRWRRDLAVAYAERGEARRKAGDLAASRADTKTALDLIRELRRVAPTDEQLASDERWLRARLR